MLCWLALHLCWPSLLAIHVGPPCWPSTLACTVSRLCTLENECLTIYAQILYALLSSSCGQIQCCVLHQEPYLYFFLLGAFWQQDSLVFHFPYREYIVSVILISMKTFIGNRTIFINMYIFCLWKLHCFGCCTNLTIMNIFSQWSFIPLKTCTIFIIMNNIYSVICMPMITSL